MRAVFVPIISTFYHLYLKISSLPDFQDILHDYLTTVSLSLNKIFIYLAMMMYSLVQMYSFCLFIDAAIADDFFQMYSANIRNTFMSTYCNQKKSRTGLVYEFLNSPAA